MWQYTGQVRPTFAAIPTPGQESVWDYPRPPALVPESRRIRVELDGVLIADTQRALKLMETASAPSFYLPLADIDQRLLVAVAAGSVCEWKGRAHYYSVQLLTGRLIERCAWAYPQPAAAYAALAGHLAFYPDPLNCTLGGVPVVRQPGGFYGGWVTPDLAGPIKGAPGTGHW